MQFQETGINFFISVIIRLSCSLSWQKMVEVDTDKQVINTHNTDVLCTNRQDVSGLAPCSHEEADTRILLHLEDAVRHRNTRVSTRTVDTNVIVLAVPSAQRLSLSELWIVFGTGKNFRFLACQKMALLPLFLAFTWCDDTVSFFSGRDKRTARDIPAFCALADRPTL